LLVEEIVVIFDLQFSISDFQLLKEFRTKIDLPDPNPQGPFKLQIANLSRRLIRLPKGVLWTGTVNRKYQKAFL
jgi:hypothetical protein